MAKVGIVIPCYNDAQYLEEAIDSAIAQTYSDIEIVVVDDGSSDPCSIAILNSISKPRTRVLRLEHSGVSVARNTGIAALDVEYILPLDADDRLAPSYVQKAVTILDAHPEIGIVCCETRFFGLRKGKFAAVCCDQLPELLFHDFLLVSSMFRKRDWSTVGGFNPKMLEAIEDTDFWLSLIGIGVKLHRIHEELFFYRWKADSRQQRFERSSNKYEVLARMIGNHEELYKRYVKYVVLEYYKQLEELREFRDYKRRFAPLVRVLEAMIYIKRLGHGFILKIMKKPRHF